MNLIPVRSVTLSSALAPPALADELRRVVSDAPGTPFAGSVAADRFVIARMNEFRSTIMPLLRGSLAPAPDGGTTVRLRLHPRRIVLAFMAIWLGFLGIAAGLLLTAFTVHPERTLPLLFVPAGLAAGSWYLMLAVFEADARWAVAHLRERVPALLPAAGGKSAPGAAEGGEELPTPDLHLYYVTTAK